MMKNWFLIPLLAVLSGCVSYYYPYTPEAETYSVIERHPVRSDWSASYASTRYYPWWSVDYFYLGSGRAYRDSGWSIGFSYGYPHGYGHGWYDPFAWYYDPWGWSVSFPLRYSYWHTPYYSRYHDHYAWHNHYWRDRYYRHHRSRHGDHDRWRRSHDDDYAHRRGDNSTLRPNRPRLRDEDPWAARDRDSLRRRYEDGRIPKAAKGKYPRPAKPGREPAAADIRRQVTVAPAGNGRQGMEIRSRELSKPSPTRVQPAPPSRDDNAPLVRVIRPAASNVPRDTRSQRRGQSVVRSAAGQKTRPVRTQPAPVPRSLRSEKLSPVVRYEPPPRPRISRQAPPPRVDSRSSGTRLEPRAAQPVARSIRPPETRRQISRPVPQARPALKQPAASQAPAPGAATRPSFRPPERSARAEQDHGKPAERSSRPGKRQKR